MNKNLTLPMLAVLALSGNVGRFPFEHIGLLSPYAPNSYKYIHHRSQKKLRRLARQKGG